MRGRDLTQGSVLRNIGAFSLPYMLAYFLQILYGLADLFVVGRYDGVESTTAVANGAQVMHLVTVVLIGLAMGTTVWTARAMGAKDRRQASLAVGNTVTLFAALSVVLAVALLWARDAIIRWLDIPAEAVAGTASYLTLCFVGIPFIIAYNGIASIFRGLGDSQSPTLFILVACVLNITLDYLLIGGLGMGPTGAALATTLAQAGSVLLAIVAIRRRKLLTLTRADLRPRRTVLHKLLSVGVPIALQDGFIQIAFLVITIIANGRGLYDAAAVGIVEKSIGVLFVVPSAMLGTVSAIAAQNIGAGKPDRARATLRQSLYICIGFGTVIALIFQFVPQWAVQVFTDNPQVAALGGEYLKGYVWDVIFAGIHFCYSGFFTACGYSILSFAHNVVSVVLARIPLAYAASRLFAHTLYPMGLATPAGSLVSVLVCVVAYRWLRRRHADE